MSTHLLCVMIQSIFIFFILSKIVSSDTGCSFTLSKNTPKTPLILKNQETPELIYPDEQNIITIPKGGHILLSCAEKHLDNAFHVKQLEAVCINDDIVQIKYHILCKKQIKIQLLECKSTPEPTLRFTEQRCYGNNVIVEIGYTINKSFLKIFSVCYDDFEEKTIYSWYPNSKLYLGHEEKIKNSAYVNSQLYSFDISSIYEYNYQRQIFTKLLKLEETAARYIKDQYLYTIVSSPLIPKDEFVFGPQQISTFHYLNTAPQWKIIKEGNWDLLEKSLKEFLSTTGKEYGVASGIYQVETLPDLFKEEQRLYLYSDKYENNYLPVPKYYWKIVYNYGAKTGTAFIIVHNPFLEKDADVAKDYVFCKDICSEVSWLKVDNARYERGYMFCCSINEFLKVTGYDNMFENVE